MAQYTTWRTEINGKVGKVRQVHGNEPPGTEWHLVPNDWGGSPDDDLSWFNEKGCRIPDAALVEKGTRKDNRGQWYNINNIGETKHVYSLDEEPGENWTRETPLKNEPYQKWDPKKKIFIIDEAQKGKAEKEQCISDKKNAIQIAEQRKLRSFMARIEGTATAKDDEYYIQFSEEIIALRNELEEIQE
jgi:hypothetical protein